jgi:SAM-dependent methyltransferase
MLFSGLPIESERPSDYTFLAAEFALLIGMARSIVLHDSEMLNLIMAWLPRGGTVLDVGCGSGRMLAALAERGISGIGIDPYASDTKRCRRLRAGEIDQLAEQFDLVYTRYALHHFDEPQQFPEKARSALRADGVLLIVDWFEGARTGVPERYFAPQVVAGWVRGVGFELLRQEVRGQSMVIAGKLPPADVEADEKTHGEEA